MFGGNVSNAGYAATYYGIFDDWKMSGRYYNDYADIRVGSPIN